MLRLLVIHHTCIISQLFRKHSKYIDYAIYWNICLIYWSKIVSLSITFSKILSKDNKEKEEEKITPSIYYIYVYSLVTFEIIIFALYIFSISISRHCFPRDRNSINIYTILTWYNWSSKSWANDDNAPREEHLRTLDDLFSYRGGGGYFILVL